MSAAKRPLLLAHRGCSARHPENTMRAFRAALKEGCDSIELDLQTSSDGEVLVFHDYELERLCKKSGRLRDYRAEELRRFFVMSDQYGLADDLRIPDLKTVLQEIGKRCPLYLELKAEEPGLENAHNKSLVEGVLKLVPEDSPHTLASFDVEIVKACAAAGRRSALIFSDIEKLDSLGETAEKLHAWSSLYKRIDKDLAARAKAAEVPLWAWTVDDRDEVERLRGLGVAGICTNDVSSMRLWLDGGVRR